MSHEGLTQRKLAWMVLRGETPPRLPFITRLEAWHRSHQRTQTLPAYMADWDLDHLHRELEVGRLKFVNAYAFRLRGVEVRARFEGKEFYHEYEPIVENFPSLWDIISTTQAGTTETDLITPRGTLHLRHGLLEEHVLAGLDPYLQQHLILEPDDYSVAEYIIERMEFVPLFDTVQSWQQHIGDNGLVVPLLQRIPFQQLLLEYLGEVNLFKALHYERKRTERLLHLLDEQMMDILPRLAPLGAGDPGGTPYVEFPDNLHGSMTSPPLFRQYCLEAYQKYTELLHAQGKKVGSHTDGDMRPLLTLLPESGLDVCESFSPFPLTSCTFEEAWQAFRNGPLIWGAIPSTWLEEKTPREEFESNVERLLSLIDRPILLGVVDLFMRHNSIERVAWIAQRLKEGK
ncbi:MAG: hypothetical protein NZ840_11390 [Anaerolineales bacterium]|nr:hypothetical protein [Anaerolineales bacterium]MDW8162642.1 hypothetical protein [Anaerolineales bacterium]